MSRLERIIVEELSIPTHPLVPAIEGKIVPRLRIRKEDIVHPFRPADVIPGHFDPEADERRRS